MANHVAVCIDHDKARIFHFHPDKIRAAAVAAPQHVHHRHHEHPNNGKTFFQAVARSLDDADEILIVGPSSARVEFSNYLRQHQHRLDARVIGIETIDHPTDGQLAAYAKKHFDVRD